MANMLIPIQLDPLTKLKRPDGTEIWLFDPRVNFYNKKRYVIAQGIYFHWTEKSEKRGIELQEEFPYRVNILSAVVPVKPTDDLLCFGMPDEMAITKQLPAFEVLERNNVWSKKPTIE